METRAPTAPRSARPGGVIGVAVGLLALVGLSAWLGYLALAGRGADPVALLEEVLPAPRPLGLELVESAALPSGDRVLRLAPAEAAVAREVVLLFLAARGAVEELFQPAVADGVKLAEWQREPDFDHAVEVARGDVAWRGWKAPFVQKRALHEGGGWSEATAVNLSTRGRNLVLTVLWSPETEASESVLDAILEGVAVPEDPTRP